MKVNAYGTLGAMAALDLTGKPEGWTFRVSSGRGVGDVYALMAGRMVRTELLGDQNTLHTRRVTGITATTATGTVEVLFSQDENVRDLNFLLPSGVLFRVVYDAVDLADAKVKMADPASDSTINVPFDLILGTGSWQKGPSFSKSPTDLSLSSVYLRADSAAGPHAGYVQGV